MGIVSEKKFLTEEEKNTLKEIQQQTQVLILELGEIELIKLQIENRYQTAKAFLNELALKEENFNQSIVEKYGKSRINPETGEITILD
jgi:NAD kinase